MTDIMAKQKFINELFRRSQRIQVLTAHPHWHEKEIKNMTYDELKKFKGWTLKEVWPEIERTRWTQYPKEYYTYLYSLLILLGFVVGVSVGYFAF